MYGQSWARYKVFLVSQGEDYLRWRDAPHQGHEQGPRVGGGAVAASCPVLRSIHLVIV